MKYDIVRLANKDSIASTKDVLLHNPYLINLREYIFITFERKNKMYTITAKEFLELFKYNYNAKEVDKALNLIKN